MRTPRGEFDKRETFERGAQVRGPLGAEPIATWTVLGTRYAKVRYGTGAERRQAATEAAGQTATVRVLQDAMSRTVRAADRIRFDGLTWDITSIAPIGRDEIEFTATGGRD